MFTKILASRSLRARLTGLALACSLAPSVLAQSFVPSEDTRTDANNVFNNYATSDLGVDTGQTSASYDFERSYLRFQVSGVDPANLGCVTLELTESSATGNVHFEVRLPNSGWTENDLTWFLQPNAIGRRVGAWIGPSVGNAQVIRIPLDPAPFAAGNGTYDLMLVEADSGGSSGVRFFSREGSSPPRLVFGCAGVGARAGFAVKVADGAAPFSPVFLPYLPADTSSVVWDFGDGTTSSSFSPSHTYTSPGRYDVKVTATNPAGTVSYTRKDYIMAYPADQAVGSVLTSTEISPLFSGGSALGLSDYDMFGRSVGAIGDLNGDGNIDIIVGAVGDDEAGTDAGAAYILALDAKGGIKGVRKITEGLNGFGGDLNAGDGFGREVAPIGDWDGDGVLDVAICSNRDDQDGNNAGAVWMLFLNSNGTVKSYKKINASNGAPIGFNAGDEFGRGIARLEDMDGDGVPELAVGAINNRQDSNRYGCVWILFMRSDGSVKSATKVSPNSGNLTIPTKPNSGGRLWFGMCVSAIGDVDGNGVTDIVVGALLDSARQSASGAGVIVLLNADGSVKSGNLINADYGGLVDGEITSNDEFGGSCAGIGDLDGDGIPDVAIGSIRDDDNVAASTDYFGDYGGIYICLLNSDGSLKNYQKISATRGGLKDMVTVTDRVGEGLAGIGDFNGDGIVDLLVGSRFNDSGGPNRGAAFIYTLNNGLGGTTPVAAFDATPKSGVTPLLVDFEDKSTGLVSTWLWDFGDGNTSSAPQPSHTYGSVGSYDVTLTVTGALGEDTLVKPGFINVSAPGTNIVVYGSGVNPAGSIQHLGGDGSLGSSVIIGVDNPLGTQAIGSKVFVTVTRFADLAFPAGSLRAGLGMDGGPGELLIRLSPPPTTVLVGSPWSGPGIASQMTLSFPNNSALLGLTFYAQGRIVDMTPGAAIPVGLTEGLAITVIP